MLQLQPSCVSRFGNKPPVVAALNVKYGTCQCHDCFANIDGRSIEGLIGRSFESQRADDVSIDANWNRGDRPIAILPRQLLMGAANSHGAVRQSWKNNRRLLVDRLF